jgi:S1 RNA binding domain protein
LSAFATGSFCGLRGNESGENRSIVLSIEVGNIYEGRVTGVKAFGAFVALPEGKTGMVHISEVSNEYVQDLSTVLAEGQQVKVKVINVAPDGKIALSIKRLLPPPPRAPREGGRGPAPREGRGGGAPRQGGGAPRQNGGKRPARNNDAPHVWQPKPTYQQQNMSFEDMMSRFKSQSEEKMADLDHETNNRRGGGYAPRGRRGNGR